MLWDAGHGSGVERVGGTRTIDRDDFSHDGGINGCKRRDRMEEDITERYPV